LKVIHFSQNGFLPDWRIEKSAITAKREGIKNFFVFERRY
jgi:hypothetical protein